MPNFLMCDGMVAVMALAALYRDRIMPKTCLYATKGTQGQFCYLGSGVSIHQHSLLLSDAYELLALMGLFPLAEYLLSCIAWSRRMV